MMRSAMVFLAGVSLLAALTLGFAAGAQEEGASAQPESASAQPENAEPVKPQPARPAASSLDELLERVRQGWNAEREENRKRESAFKSTRDRQQTLLNDAKAALKREEDRSQQLENNFEQKEIQIAQLEETLADRMGNLGELFGVVRQVAGDAAGKLDSSLVTAQLPGRAEFLVKLGQTKSLPSIESLEKLWFVLHQQATEQGKVSRFRTTVVAPDGGESEQDVIRVGDFNVVAGGKYLVWETGKLRELPRQPAGSVLSTLSGFESATSGVARLAVDPSRGTLLSLLVETPDVRERVSQGGVVGYAIIIMGAFAGLLGLVRLLVVSIASRKVAAQKKTETINTGNPLGRVLSVWDGNPEADVETLELKLDEVILRESSKLERLLWAIKVASVLAPLMGLLGTVTGMIRTFQSIMLYGAGDPKLMAGGISEALVTTMLGLIVAIPLVFLHAWVTSSSKGVVEVLEEQAAGIVARRAEQP
jgi:biopolymer transport protein ExbB